MDRPHLLLFFDGQCGLCHRAVRFALHHDPQGERFRYAPLQGTTLHEVLDPGTLANLSDSIVVVSPDGEVRQESNAVLEIAKHIGGGWAVAAKVAAIVPRPLRDLVYRCIARIRHRLFRRPPDLCPVVPAPLRERFLP